MAYRARRPLGNVRLVSASVARVRPTCEAAIRVPWPEAARSEEHTSELQSLRHLVCRLLLEKKLAHTLKLSDVKAADYDAVFYPGGHGPLWDLVKNSFFNDTATTEIYPLSLHDALPISVAIEQVYRNIDTAGRSHRSETAPLPEHDPRVHRGRVGGCHRAQVIELIAAIDLRAHQIIRSVGVQCHRTGQRRERELPSRSRGQRYVDRAARHIAAIAHAHQPQEVRARIASHVDPAQRGHIQRRRAHCEFHSEAAGEVVARRARGESGYQRRP